MRWIVTFLDAIVLLYFLSGIVVWKNAFPEYIHSEYAEKFSENGLDAILFVNVNPYFQFLRPPDCFYDVWVKHQEDLQYYKLVVGYFGRGGFGSDGCSGENKTVPNIRVFRTDNNLKFISVYRISQYHFDEDRLDLYAVPKNANNRYVMGINLKVKSDLSFADSSASDDKILEMYLDNRYETSCSIFVLSKRTHYELSASENESNQAAMEFFRDTIRVHALYDVFKQMHLKPACVDSLVLHYTSMLLEQIPVFWKSPNRITTTK
ncbi:hypothetical protein [uncultured Fibrobacter sp.]|uniref:hypothetical protein n=1 Tax=uncultured Fibrobacter sp. TaxID=261512 RepID=UPI0025D87748|nr:hypothetical protein [uncultured Fibrobacter sp.]